ncbi:MAG: hypothetical protein M0Q49_03290 [Porticoccaceae bacterium]|nr:hypothetical protein [Porticoccaceae bacterium]
MRIYCKYDNIGYSSTYTVEQVIVRNHVAEVDDEEGSRLVLLVPELFRVKPFEKHELVVKVPNSPPHSQQASTEEPAPIQPPVIDPPAEKPADEVKEAVAEADDAKAESEDK